jgi:hypothetical protein
VNLQNVPVELRPDQEALDPDDIQPWNGKAAKPAKP